MKGKIFNTQEVQSILSGNKTQFREVIKPQPNDQQKHISKTTFSQNKEEIGKVFLTNHDFSDLLSRRNGEQKIECPYQVGQEIFVKESFWQFGSYDGGSDCDEPKFIGKNKITFCPEEAAKPQTLCKGWKKRPAQHMKQEHSRLTLQITEIRVERLADISEEDAKKEGVDIKYNDYFGEEQSFVGSFKRAWNATHKKPEEKFEANPWCWVISFEEVK